LREAAETSFLLKVIALDKAGKQLASVSSGAQTDQRFYTVSPHLATVFLVRSGDVERFRVDSRSLVARS